MQKTPNAYENFLDNLLDSENDSVAFVFEEHFVTAAFLVFALQKENLTEKYVDLQYEIFLS